MNQRLFLESLDFIRGLLQMSNKGHSAIFILQITLIERSFSAAPFLTLPTGILTPSRLLFHES